MSSFFDLAFSQAYCTLCTYRAGHCCICSCPCWRAELPRGWDTAASLCLSPGSARQTPLPAGSCCCCRCCCLAAVERAAHRDEPARRYCACPNLAERSCCQRHHAESASLLDSNKPRCSSAATRPNSATRALRPVPYRLGRQLRRR
jgi:hypothetical protein